MEIVTSVVEYSSQLAVGVLPSWHQTSPIQDQFRTGKQNMVAMSEVNPRRMVFVIAMVMTGLYSTTIYAQQPETERKELIWVAIYDHSPGTASGPKNLKRFLTTDNGFQSVILTPEDIQAGRLEAFDLLVMPGGSGSSQSKHLQEQGRENIRNFVKNGGGYCGICAGSYLASSDYTWSLHLINAKVFDRAHWARGTGDVILKLSDQGQELLKNDEEEITVYYGQGPLLVPDTKQELPAYEALAEYATEIAKKGAPTGVMIGTTAIARAPYGEGRVICYSPHPEKAEETEHLILEGVIWAAKKRQVSDIPSEETSTSLEPAVSGTN